MSNIGTPDNQYGVVSPQILLATVAANTAVATVTLPPNVSSLLLMSTGFSTTLPAVIVLGTTTNISYPATFRRSTLSFLNVSVYVVEVNPVLDAAVAIDFTGTAPTSTWYVVGLMGPYVVDVPALNNSIGAPASAKPGNALLVGGSDGTNLRAVLTDSSGNQLTIDQNLKLVIAARGAALPADAVMIGGSDGTDIRAIETDSNGRTIPLVPTLTTGAVVCTSNTTLIAAPSSGHNYLFAMDIANTSGASSGLVWIAHGTAGGVISQVYVPASTTVTVPLQGFAMTDALLGNAAGANVGITVRYATGP